MFCKLTGLVEMQVGAVIFDVLFALLVEALHIHSDWALNVEMLNSFVLAKKKKKGKLLMRYCLPCFLRTCT